MVWIIVASSLFKALGKKITYSEERNIIAKKELICIHDQKIRPTRWRQETIKSIDRDKSKTIWHDACNSSISYHHRYPREKNLRRTRVRGLNLHQISGITYSEREKAPDIIADPEDLISNYIRQNSELIAKYRALHQESLLEVKTLDTEKKIM